MPMRLKVQYLTRVEKQCIGYLGNGMRASTAVVLPHPLVSGERVSIWLISPKQKEAGHGQRNHTWVGVSVHSVYLASTCFELCWSYWPIFHSPSYISDSSSSLTIPLLG